MPPQSPIPDPQSLKNAVLLLVDVQKGLDHPHYGERNNLGAEKVIETLLAHWREQDRPVIHNQHCSTEPNSPLRPELPTCDFKPEAQPIGDEPIFQKSVNSCFIGTELDPYLREHGYDTLVIAGLTTPHCVSTTTRMAGNLGYTVYLVADGTACHGLTHPNGQTISADTVHHVALAELHGEFCTVVKSADLLG